MHAAGHKTPLSIWNQGYINAGVLSRGCAMRLSGYHSSADANKVVQFPVPVDADDIPAEAMVFSLRVYRQIHHPKKPGAEQNACTNLKEFLGVRQYGRHRQNDGISTSHRPCHWILLFSPIDIANLLGWRRRFPEALVQNME